MTFALACTLFAVPLGLVLGSFLNVVIARLPDDQSVVAPRSRCPQCGHTIRWYDNIPLLSFSLLRGRCRDCHQPIAWRYPAVELTTGLWLGVVALQASAESLRIQAGVHPGLDQYLALGVRTLSVAVLGLVLIPLLVIDWEHHRLPDLLTLPGVLAGLLLTCAEAALLPPGAYDIHFDPRRNLRLRSPGSFVARGDVFLTGTEHLIFGRVVAVLAAAGLLLAIRALYRLARRREGLGLGDAKLLALIAAFLGFWPAVLSLFVGVLLGTLYAVVLLAQGHATRVTRLPLGSFLCAGALFAATLGPTVIAWYRTLL